MKLGWKDVIMMDERRMDERWINQKGWRREKEGWTLDGRRMKGGLIKQVKGWEEGDRRIKEGWIRQKGWKKNGGKRKKDERRFD